MHFNLVIREDKSYMNSDNEDIWICGLCANNENCPKHKDLQEKCFTDYCESILEDNDNIIE